MVYAPDMQAAYIEFGCNTGDVYVVGIDKGSYNSDVMIFKNMTGVEYPGVSGFEGGGNNVHDLFQIQSTPSIVIVRPDRSIATKHLYPPTYQNVVDSILYAGGILQACITGTGEQKMDLQLTISPNPVRQKARVLLQTAMDEVFEVEVYNAMGKPVKKYSPQLFDQYNRHFEIDLSDVEKGIYFLHLTGDGGTSLTRKFLVQ